MPEQTEPYRILLSKRVATELKRCTSFAFVWLVFTLFPLAARAADAPGAAGAANPTGKHPNIVFFIADDMSVKDCSAYGPTNVPGPHMAALAKEGMTSSITTARPRSCTTSRPTPTNCTTSPRSRAGCAGQPWASPPRKTPEAHPPVSSGREGTSGLRGISGYNGLGGPSRNGSKKARSLYFRVASRMGAGHQR